MVEALPIVMFKYPLRSKEWLKLFTNSVNTLNMLKKFLTLGLALAIVASPVLAGAAAFTNVQFQNGQTTIEGVGGATVTATIRVVVPAGEVVEQIQTDVLSDGLAPVCTSVGGELGLQEGTHEVSLPIKLPLNVATHNLEVQGSGIFGGFRANDCVGDVVGSQTFTGALRVVANGSTTGGNTGGNTGGTEQPAWLTALLAQIQALIASINSGNTGGTPSSFCASVDKYSDLGYGDRGTRVTAFQRLLIKNGYNTIATGFYGNMTEAAAGEAQADCD